MAANSPHAAGCVKVETPMFRLTIALVAAASLLAAAQPLSADAARRTFFGVDMSGVMKGEGRDVPWRECVEASGETVYWFAGEVDRGRLRVREDGGLCFSYKSSGYADEACFAAYPEGRGQYRFVGVDGGSVFITRQMRKIARACPTGAMVS
jgi:hypothetical protein